MWFKDTIWTSHHILQTLMLTIPLVLLWNCSMWGDVWSITTVSMVFSNILGSWKYISFSLYHPLPFYLKKRMERFEKKEKVRRASSWYLSTLNRCKSTLIKGWMVRCLFTRPLLIICSLWALWIPGLLPKEMTQFPIWYFWRTCMMFMQ